MAQFIASIILCLVIIDVTLIGILPRAFGIWYPYFSYVNQKNIIEKCLLYSFSTNLGHDLWSSHAAYRIHILYFVISEEYLIIRNTFLTCLPPIIINDIESARIKNCLIGKRLIFKFKSNGKKYFKVRIRETNDWESKFASLGIKMASS